MKIRLMLTVGFLIVTLLGMVGYVRAATANEVLMSTLNIIFITTIVIIALGLFIVFFIARSLSKSIVKLTNVANEVAKGNLDVNIGMTGQNELGRLASALKKMTSELKEIAAEKGKFITLVSHELRTPMTHIIGFSKLLQSERVASKKQLRSNYLKIIHNELKRLDGLLGIMLDLTKFDLGVYKHAFQRFSLLEFMRDMERRMRPLINKKKLKSSFEIPNLIITTNKEALQTMLSNLITNAVNFTAEGEITVKVIKEGKFLHFSVADTGIGIDKKYHNEIFKRFFQVDVPSTRKIAGPGLGLSLCREIVKDMGGKIWVESQLRKGSTFHFTLPIKIEE